MSHAAAGAITVRPHHVDDLCVVAPSPEIKDKLVDQFERLRNRAAGLVGRSLTLSAPNHVGLNDGLIYPGTSFPLGTTAAVAQRAALERAPLRGPVRVVVVLADFSDKELDAGAADRFSQLFFSTGELPHGSVKEYFADVSNGLIDIQGEVVGPYRMPRTIAAYAGADNGLQSATPNARTLADDAVTAAHADVDFTPYDNDGNGYVDAFIVVHAGRGGEETGSASDIWSHKWVLPAERAVDGTKIFAYLTIPEDAKLGVTTRNRQPGLRLARPLRHRQHLRGDRQLVPDGVRVLGPGRHQAGAPVGLVQGHPGVDRRGLPHHQCRGHHLRREDQPDRVPAVEGRRRRQRVLPGREPPAGGLRSLAAPRCPAR